MPIPFRINAVGSLATATALLAVGVVGAAHATTSRVEGFDPSTTDAIDRAVSSVYAQRDAPGYGVQVVIPGVGEYARAYGVANRQTGSPAQVEDHFRIGSITKTMTGVAVMRLADQGRLSLDDHLDRYVRGVANGGRITVRQLLAMRAGVYDFTGNEPFVRASWRNPLMPWTVDDTIQLIRSGAPQYAPGTSGRYDNSDFVLLGRVIERATGRPALDVVRDEVLVPAGLADTTLPTTTGMPGPFRRGYAQLGDGRQRDMSVANPWASWTAGSGISTLADLTTWARVLGTGALLSTRMHAQQLTTTRLQGYEPDRRYGLAIITKSGWRGHWGTIPGYNAATYYDPTTGATIAVTGSTGGTDDAVFAVSKAIQGTLSASTR